MQQLWLMGKQVLEKHILWKDLNTIYQMNKEELYQGQQKQYSIILKI